MSKIKSRTEAKKQLKKIINDNGFFTSAIVKGNQIDDIESKIEKLKKKKYNKVVKTNAIIPEGENIIFLHGVSSQQFEGLETNRNQYKIDQGAWMYDGYSNNPVIFLGHDRNEIIGQALYIFQGDKQEEILFYVDLNSVEKEADKNRIKNGLLKGLSTGHLDVEWKWEDKDSGKRYTDNEMIEKFDYDEFDLWWKTVNPDPNFNFILVVTKADRLETSLVSLPSNPKATLFNSLHNFFKKNMLPDQKTKKNEEGEIEKTEITETPENDGEEKNNEEAEAKDETPEKKVEIETKEEGGDLEKPAAEEDNHENKVVQNKLKELIKENQSLKSELAKTNEFNNSLVKIVGEKFNDVFSFCNSLQERLESLENIPNKKVLSFNDMNGRNQSPIARKLEAQFKEIGQRRG